MNTLRLPIVAVLFAALLAACATSDPEVSAQLDELSDRLGELESQLDDISATVDEIEASEMEAEHEEVDSQHASNSFEIAVVQYVMDNAGFHTMDEQLAETGTIDPTNAATVMLVSRVVASTEWPDDLAEDASHLVEVLGDFHAALVEDDADAAAPLAGMAHEHQHDLSAAISAWLSGEMSMENEHEHEDEAAHGDEMHQPEHGGQVGMSMGTATGGKDFHIEMVSNSPGQYVIYLSDADRVPIGPQGYSGTLALIRPDGSEIESLALTVMSDHLMAEGGPLDIDHADVRITLEGPDLEDVLEMEFSIAY